jgi:hypothetical protein
VHVRLEDSEAFLKRGELLEKPFLSKVPFRATVVAFISSLDCFFHDVLLAPPRVCLDNHDQTSIEVMVGGNVKRISGTR